MDRLSVLDNMFSGLKFKDAVYNETTHICTVSFLYNPECFKPCEENNKTITDRLNETIGDYVKYELNFISCPLDKRTIANHAYTTIINNFPSISKNFTYEDVAVDIDAMQVTVTLKLEPTSYDHAVEFDRSNMIAENLKNSFLADFIVKFDKKEGVKISESSAIESNIELLASVKEAEEKTVFELNEVSNIIGKNDYTLAIDYSKIANPIENVVICGIVVGAQKKSYKKTYTKNNEKKEIEHIFYNFTLKNENKFMYCSIFPKGADEIKGDLIEAGLKVCCFGSFREFNGKLNFTATSIARCEFKKEEIKSGYKSVNNEYHTVFPTEYVDYEQKGLFDEDDKFFPGTYVVFDLETTGLEPTKDEIIEIGACKIVNGKIEEVFSTFVKPNRKIPKEITDLTGITNQMVEDAPSINYVLPDFYKFCYNSTMVAHNIAFDISFIHNISKKLSYNFDNPNMDTMVMAREKLPGLKNYKLGTIVDRLGVVLDNAHRAVNDATATAKVFIKLM